MVLFKLSVHARIGTKNNGCKKKMETNTEITESLWDHRSKTQENSAQNRVNPRIDCNIPRHPKRVKTRQRDEW
jgi:hypothetical protein